MYSQLTFVSSSRFILLQKDLLRRLRNIVEVLRNDEDEIDVDEYPGLGALADLLVTKPYLQHKDKEVRLYTVLSCVEVFYVVSLIQRSPG